MNQIKKMLAVPAAVFALWAMSATAATNDDIAKRLEPVGQVCVQGQECKGMEVAAVDLGSNSFHMMVARSNGSELQVIDRLREPVRLAAGLDADKRLHPEAQARALACLQRFGQRLRGLPQQQVRAVGTNTMRRMRRSEDFLAAAEMALGHEIEIISGAEAV